MKRVIYIGLVNRKLRTNVLSNIKNITFDVVVIVVLTKTYKSYYLKS